MTRYKAVVSYDGTRYVGWQRQTNGLSVQEVIETACQKIAHQTVRITASGRTDAQVHALGQVFHFDSELHMNSQQWLKALNALLPPDIWIKTICPVKDTFHARFDAIGKRYDYWLNTGSYNVFERNLVTQWNTPLQIDKMRQAAGLLIGTHDFTSFNATPLSLCPDQVRCLRRLDILQQQDKIHLIFEGDGFLRYMVRMITGTLIEVGKGKLDPKEAQMILNARNKTACTYNAQPCGLYLVRVDYPESSEISENNESDYTAFPSIS